MPGSLRHHRLTQQSRDVDPSSKSSKRVPQPSCHRQNSRSKCRRRSKVSLAYALNHDQILFPSRNTGIMLKRLSFGSDAPVSPLPPRSPGNHSTSYPFPTIPPSPNNSSAKHPASNNSDTKSLPIERKALHAFIKSFSSLLLILNEFKDLSNALARCERRLGKGLSEIATLCDEEKRSGTVVGMS